MKKALFNEIFGLMKELGIKLQLGTRTNVKKHPSLKHFGKDLVSEEIIQKQIDERGVDKVLKVFESEGAYIPQFDDYQGKTFLKNLNKLKTVLHPPPPKPSNVIDYMAPEGLGGLKLQKEIGEGKKIWKALGLDSTSDKDAMKYLSINDEMKKLGLDIDKMSDVEKYLGKETTQGIGSMFKRTDDPGSVVQAPKTTDEIIKGIDQELTPTLFKDERPVSVTDELTNLVDESKTFMEDAQKLKDLAFRLTPEYEAQQQAKNKLKYQLRYEGKGYAGGMQNEGYFRAVVRPFLLREHDAGKIKLSDSVYKSLKNSDDLTSGGFMDQQYPDPIRVFRHHYGDNAFDIIPPDIQSPARSDILQAFDEVSIQPITAQGPRNTGGYLTAGEYRGKMADINDSIKAIEEGGGRFDAMTRDEKLKEIAQVNLRKETLKKAFKQDHPGELLGTETFDELTIWGQKPEDFNEGGIAGLTAEKTYSGYKKGELKHAGLSKSRLEELVTLHPELAEEVEKILAAMEYSGGGRVGFRAGGGAFKKFIEGLFIKASNDIRQGRGMWKGLDLKQKTQQHDNLTKIVDKFMKTGEFDQAANEYFGLDAEIAFAEAQGKTFLKGPQKMPSSHQENKILDAAYEDVAHHLKLEDLKYEADVLADSYANQLGKVYDDMADAERSALYDQSYKRLASNLRVKMDLAKMDQKVILSEFDPKGRKPNAFGGGVGSMFRVKAAEGLPEHLQKETVHVNEGWWIKHYQEALDTYLSSQESSSTPLEQIDIDIISNNYNHLKEYGVDTTEFDIRIKNLMTPTEQQDLNTGGRVGYGHGTKLSQKEIEDWNKTKKFLEEMDIELGSPFKPKDEIAIDIDVEDLKRGGRVGYQPGGRVLAKGAVWFIRAMKKNLEDMLAGHPRFEKIPKEELDVISQQMQFMIREIESGKEVPIEALQAIKDNPNYYRSGRVTRAQDPDMAEVEELIVEKLGGDEVSEVLAGFDVTKRKPNAYGGGVGSMFRRV